MNKEKTGYADRSVNNMATDKLKQMKAEGNKKNETNEHQGKEHQGK